MKREGSKLQAKIPIDFVLDCSVTMAWCFEDESTEQTDAILDSLNTTTAIAPTIWALEVSNVLLIAEKNKRISSDQVSNFIDALDALPIIIDETTTTRAMSSIYRLAQKKNLTIYDAAYLELASREKIPIATFDKSMIKAAKQMDIDLFLPSTLLV